MLVSRVRFMSVKISIQLIGRRWITPSSSRQKCGIGWWILCTQKRSKSDDHDPPAFTRVIQYDSHVHDYVPIFSFSHWFTDSTATAAAARCLLPLSPSCNIGSNSKIHSHTVVLLNELWPYACAPSSFNDALLPHQSTVRRNKESPNWRTELMQHPQCDRFSIRLQCSIFLSSTYIFF